MPIDQPATVVPVVVQTARLPPAAGDPAFSIVAVSAPILKLADRLDEALDSAPRLEVRR
jgi:hypothetical protein